MSVIGVRGIPLKYNIQHVVKLLAKIVKGHFEVVNFVAPKFKSTKICYLRLSETLDPEEVVERINKRGMGLIAFIPRHVPDLPSAAPKKGKIPRKLSRSLGIRPDEKPYYVMKSTHSEIMTELQSKYTGLYNLSKKTGHKLMESISRTVFERLKHIMETNEEAATVGFKLSKSYRKLHPHFGDFQLILSTLHRLQDASGVPRTQLLDTELTTVTTQPFVIENIPYDKVRAACNKYSDRIIKKVLEHVNSLETKINEVDTDEEIARKKVREELGKLSPYLPSIIKQVIVNHFVPQKLPFHRMRIYGEPFLPTRDPMTAFLKRHRAVKIMRSDRMYNVLKFNIPLSQYASLVAMDGTVIGGAKLVIRSSEVPVYKAPVALAAEMKAMFGVEQTEDTEVVDVEPEEEEWTDKWSEEVAA